MKLPRLAGLAAGCLAFAFPLLAEPAGQFTDHGDIGAPKIAGSTSYDAARQEYALSAGGVNIWGAKDEFQFASRKIKGDFILRARAGFLGQGTDPHRKLGWMVRSTLDADSPYVDGAVHGDGLTSLQFRRTKGSETKQFPMAITHPDVIQLERRGNLYTLSVARYGEPFVRSELADLDLGDEVNVGLFLCAHNGAVEEKAVFRDVMVIKPAAANFTPYRDYIGSVLHTLEVQTGKLETLYSSAEPFEAPNWMHDGKTLLYNVSGRGDNRGLLRRFDLATRTPAPFDTGFATRNNNDHVLSFDGTMLGISHQGPETNGRSSVYVLPATGGTPRMVTPLQPSYFHGWSPDGKWLVYAGGRKETPDAKVDKYDIYKIALDGGDEIKLGAAGGRSDGPEYSPDGKWIYFNSTRNGLMQIWRMKPDGTEPEQITSDEYNNWFPHISPDGKWIAFISYDRSVSPEDHPYYKHCYLRLMPIANGPAKIIAYVYGGQGTINVPSWSPDSTKIAFVSNTDEFK
jgi:hypothetical protein